MSGGYVLGHSEQELKRLAEQARVIDPITRRIFEQAGIGRGMRVLDVGSGVGDVAFLIADLVGRLGPRATLHRIEGGDHSFRVPRADGRSAGQVEDELAAATIAWLAQHGLARPTTAGRWAG